MSMHTLMSSQERRTQAAAICREIQTSNDDTMDLGRKVSAPKDIMLDELSLSSNRGSRLFKMRQRRSEKYTFESVRNEANMQMSNLLAQTSETTEDNSNGRLEIGNLPKTPPNTPDPRTQLNPDSIAPGYGGPLKDVPPERFNSTAVPRSYHSPWGQILINDPNLADTLNLMMPVPEPKAEGPDYKSFNRVATPFGGFDKAPRVSIPKAPELDQNPPIAFLSSPEHHNPVVRRPTFNRTAHGWVAYSAPPVLPTVHLEPMLVPESEDL